MEQVLVKKSDLKALQTELVESLKVREQLEKEIALFKKQIPPESLLKIPAAIITNTTICANDRDEAVSFNLQFQTPHGVDKKEFYQKVLKLSKSHNWLKINIEGICN